jgi:alkylation response protein AidB-like acyl-CoA dehydrogenase
MPQFKVPLEDMVFLLHDVFNAERFLAGLNGSEELSTELLDAILEEAARISEALIAPINQLGDQQGCRFEGGRVITPDGFQEAYQTFSEGGWGALTGDPAHGGQGMPKLLSVLFEEMLFAANPSFALYPLLTNGAALALNLHGSEELKQKYLPNLYAGRWSGTMCLTESHAGTDLGIMKTRAVPQTDGSYKVTGTKIFITGGEHDLCENIIHFVLARLPDGPEGSHGISLFLVPKLLVNEAGETGGTNGVSCGSIEHKMGIKASATCVMNFDDATGYLIGGENQGLACMFTMMNYERLSMGLQGIGLSEFAYQVARDYARDRIQGRAPAGPVNPQQSADPIIVHPDVRRMLLTMRADILAGRALALYAASCLDTVKFSADETSRESASCLVELLTPLVKAYCTDRGFQDCVLGQQVLGGHGYIQEWGLEQAVRDARIAQIYEGTNGVQALDLMGRKTVKSGGKNLAVLVADIDRFIEEHASLATLQPYLQTMKHACRELQAVTDHVIEKARDEPAEIGAASYAYLELTGMVLYGYMWCRILAAAQQPSAREYPQDYRDGLVQVGRFFFERRMPHYQALAAEITAGAGSLMTIRAEQF